jgi:hypothetical protein
VTDRPTRSAASGIRHVLFDADGVIQSLPGGWYAAIEPYVGERAEEFLHGSRRRIQSMPEPRWSSGSSTPGSAKK